MPIEDFLRTDDPRYAEIMAAKGEGAESPGVLSETLPPVPRPDAPGVRSLGLTAPIGEGADRLAMVSLRPLDLGEFQDWLTGLHHKRNEVLTLMSGLPDETLRRLSGPDVEALLMTAGAMLPPIIRERLLGDFEPEDLDPAAAD